MKVFIQSLKEGRNLLLAISSTAIALIILVVLMYPGDEQALSILTTLEDVGVYKILITSTYGEGAEFRFWLAFEIFSFVFFIPIFMAVLQGSSIFAGEQDDNRLDILMSMPLSRRRIYIEEWFSMVLFSIIIVSIGFFSTCFFSTLMNYTLPLDILFATWFLMIPLIIFFGTLASLFGIFLLEKFKARIYLFELIAVMFFITIISRVDKSLDIFSYFSIFRYYNGAEILLKPNFTDINLLDPFIPLILTIFLLIFILGWIEKHDLIPHYDQEKPMKKGKIRGIPRSFFYVRYLRNKYPSLVQQISADQMIINLFLLFLVALALSGPLFYPGDAEWALSVTSMGSNIMYDAMLQGRAVPGTLQGYMITQGYAALWLWLGIFIVIIGPRLITRDNSNNTTDMLMSNPVKRERLLLERIGAFTLEMTTFFIFLSISSAIGQLVQNDSSAILSSTISFAIAIVLYWSLAIVGVVIALIFSNRPKSASSIFAVIYMLVLAPYLMSGISEGVRPLAQLTPFYWYDAYAIFVEKTITLQTVGPVILFFGLGIVAIYIALTIIGRIDIINTFSNEPQNIN